MIESIEKPAAVKTMPASKLHLPYLDGLRAVLALFVAVHHAYLTVWSEFRYHGYANIPKSIFLYGHWAVTAFIVISGFCLMLPVVRNGGALRGGARTFYRRRAHRILPTYYAALFVSLLLCVTLIGNKTGTHWDLSIPVTPLGFADHLLLLQNFDRGEINHAMWSVAVECQIYLLFPIIVLLWQRRGAAFAVGLTTLFSFVVWFITRKTALFGLSAHYLGIFAFGALGAQIVFGEGRWQELRNRVPWVAGSLLMFLAICMIPARSAYGPSDSIDWGIGLCVAGLLVGLTQSGPNPVARLLSLRPLVWIGTFSYSIYLMHSPLLQVVWQYLLHPFHFSDRTTFILLSVPGLALIVAASYAFFLVCERPFLNARR